MRANWPNGVKACIHWHFSVTHLQELNSFSNYQKFGIQASGWDTGLSYLETYLGEEFSLLRVFKWNREGAKHTARFVGVIWFSFTAAVTSLKK